MKSFFNPRLGTEEDEETKTGSNTIFGEDRLDMLAHLIRTEIDMEEAKSGWFTKVEK